ncbi:endonuclease III [Bullifex porci]|uniref:Endonuclease III n=1 Tax=Bullifex porci TaxID=2606638 RepID=A0A7X2TQ92_9SPIO|nr:endonuclease III [Bullifex porci]MDD7254610.1 endonuclease III [Bullifex porci]MDD7589474.1 endonuclease III [Bullifex porci]MDY2741829.1 endonuclease III [Bullifex porci]MSU06244.1 endonuclease III [Bullifex porci]
MNFDEAYFDRIFALFQEALKKKKRNLPSVSLIALKMNTPYTVLISTLISLRTKDDVTLAASERLFSLADNPEKMLSLSDEEIEKAIYPAGFYKRKAQNIKEISKTLIEKYDGKVPSTQEELLALPGVGIKTANLTLNLGFNIDAICVDCHVHQIANRIGWIDTKTPEESVDALESIMPRRFWIPLNELLVAYGQNVCLSISPLCSECPICKECPKKGLKYSR